ncbi:MAG: single-stranded-DNA-specific exonuclease RecJ [Bacteroidales bacterium]|nr:single-stranded-DNA-specific exonuclease RecJ [Bacteroidales bacterium]
MEKSWILRPQFTDNEVYDLSQQLGKLDLHLTKMLYARGIKDFESARLFFRPILNLNAETVEEACNVSEGELEKLHNPFLMNDMDKAINRLSKAIDQEEKILIYGDYDVDGTTSVALVYSFLSEFHKNIDFYIPDRYTEGYGISFKGVDYAKQKGCTLIIALDCGIKEVDKTDYANQNNIDIIICDHHTPGETLPKAIAVLDAKRVDNTYPFNELSGCGVGFKLLQALSITRNIPINKLLHYIDLVAVSVASDIVPIVDENRVFAYNGLQKLNIDPLICFRSIIKQSGFIPKTPEAPDFCIWTKPVEISDALFLIGPRINAAGRIHQGKDAVKLLISKSEEEADEYSKQISEYNEERKGLDKKITLEALTMLGKDPKNNIKTTTVVCGKSWHKGVVGIVASRLTETYYRPTIVLSEIDGKISGSARSVGDFNLYDAIDSCRQYLEGFGGHRFAAGLNLKVENLEPFKEAFENYVKTHIQPYQKIPKIEIEQYIDFNTIQDKFYRILKQFEPFGPENPTPIFATKNVCDVNSRVVGKTGEHLRLEIMDQDGIPMVGIAFGMAEYFPRIQAGEKFDVCYTIEKNTFRDNSYYQLMIKDIKMADNG